MEEPEVARAAVGEAVLVVAEVLLAEAPSHDPIPAHHAGAPRARHRRRAGSTAAAQRMPLVKEFRHGVSKTRLRRAGRGRAGVCVEDLFRHWSCCWRGMTGRVWWRPSA